MNNKVALITGAASGLGKEVSIKLASDGWLVVGTTRGERNDGGKADHPNLTYVEAEMTDPVSLAAAVEETVKRHGRLDMLYCNAAVQGFAALDALTLEQWNETLAVNLTAPFLLAKAAHLHLAKCGGVVVLAASVHAVRSAPSRLAYAVSKSGLLALGRNLAAEFSDSGARAVTLILGPMRSTALEDSARRFFPNLDIESALAAFSATQPMGRIGNAAEIAGTLKFLSSPAAAFISGTAIQIDGGQATCLAVPPLPEERSDEIEIADRNYRNRGV